ncbi:hypothetical protein SULAR_05003 [Sulfurovum sp. AR]|nr:hypothetical protein SULAR_05003 [Sulfurovum sp. AR]
MFGNYIWDYYANTILNYTYALTSFFLGYLLFLNKRKKVKLISIQNYEKFSINFVRVGMLIGVLAYVLWGITSGKSLQNIFLLGLLGFQDKVNTAVELGGNNYLKLMIEIFIPILSLALFTSMKKIEFSFWLLITIVIYLSQGFRYRIVLLLISFSLIYLFRNKVSINKILKLSLLVIPILILLLEFTQYRKSIRQSVVGIQTEFQVNDRPIFDTLFASSRNYLANASLIKYMVEENITYGYGDTMIMQVFIRMMPSSMFNNGVKPDPRGLMISNKSWGNRDAMYAGEAYDAVGGAYYELGSLGVIIFFLLLGFIVGYVNRKMYSAKNVEQFVLYVIIISSFFQLLTRGYLPQFFFTFGFMMLPFIIIKLRKSKKVVIHV